MSTFTFDNEKCLLKPVICEGRQLSVMCHVEAILEVLGVGSIPVAILHSCQDMKTIAL